MQLIRARAISPVRVSQPDITLEERFVKQRFILKFHITLNILLTRYILKFDKERVVFTVEERLNQEYI